MNLTVDPSEVKRGYDDTTRAYHKEGAMIDEIEDRLLNDIRRDQFGDYQLGIVKSLHEIKLRHEKQMVIKRWLAKVIFRKSVKSTRKG